MNYYEDSKKLRKIIIKLVKNINNFDLLSEIYLLIVHSRNR